MTDNEQAAIISEIRATMERLERAVGSASPYPSDEAISRAVRCEMAHLRLGPAELGRAIAKTSTTASYRIKGTYAFNRSELPGVAALLGLSLAQLLELAALHERAAAIRGGAQARPVAEPDWWRQPSRSIARPRAHPYG